jgi:hypothetical protein
MELSEVTAVHLHEGAAGQNGADLFTFVVGLLDETVRSVYNGRVPFETLFDLAVRGLVYIDVHTRSHPNGELRGQLELVSLQDWQQATYCGD